MTVELIKLIPSLLWFLFAVVILVLFYRPIRRDLLPNLASLRAGGLELSFVRHSLDAALELAEKSPQWKVKVPTQDKERVLRRAKQRAQIFADSRFLWVDDHPENNLNERRMFSQLKVEIDAVKSTEEALDAMKQSSYDLVISDMARGNDPAAGLKLLEFFRKENRITPLIFYIGVFEPENGIPHGAFGITNRPDELLHLSLDALERRKC